MRWRVFWRQVFKGKWKFARLILENFLYALTHTRCRQCGARKPWLESRCYSCQWNNLKRGLYEETSVHSEQETGGSLGEGEGNDDLL
jgi:ribosomal protein L40E